MSKVLRVPMLDLAAALTEKDPDRRLLCAWTRARLHPQLSPCRLKLKPARRRRDSMAGDAGASKTRSMPAVELSS